MPEEAHRHDRERADRLSWIADLGAVTAEALAQREQVSLNSARGLLLASSRAGLLVRSRPLTARPALYTLTRAGLRACGLGGEQRVTLSATNAEHMVLCAGAAAALERCYPTHRVVGEPALRRLERERGRAVASTLVGRDAEGAPRFHRPDLVLWHRGEGALPLAVEVELTVKAPRRLVRICRSWARSRDVGGVLYVAAPAARRAVERAVARVRAQDRILVLGLEALGLDGFDCAQAGHPERRACR